MGAAQALEVDRLAAESPRHAAEIAAVDGEQKAAIGPIDADLVRVPAELDGAARQSHAMQKDRDAAFGELGVALYDSSARPARRGAGKRRRHRPGSRAIGRCGALPK